MKYFTASNQHPFSWEQICQGFWQRYPNPYSTHVISDDIISRTLQKGKLFTKRLIIKTNNLPKWGERFVPGPRSVCLVEESVVDLENKSLTTYTRNVGYTSILTVDEKCIYTPATSTTTSDTTATTSSDPTSTTTTCARSAFIECRLRGLSSTVQRFALERYKMNISKSVKGFEVVLRGMYGGEGRSGGRHEKLRNASEAAKKIASSIIVLN